MDNCENVDKKRIERPDVGRPSRRLRVSLLPERFKRAGRERLLERDFALEEAFAPRTLETFRQ